MSDNGGVPRRREEVKTSIQKVVGKNLDLRKKR